MGLGIRDVRICFENPMTDDRRTQVKIIGTMFESHSLGYVSELRLNRQLQQHVASVTSGKQLMHSQVIRSSMVRAKPAYSISPTGLQGWNGIPLRSRARPMFFRRLPTEYPLRSGLRRNVIAGHGQVLPDRDVREVPETA